ncbi:hypothetical protein B0H11DRAFT_1956500 [Mycena galericulata]|nr:hypothetical protein B0H11DRAFT_1956500 [Mycena galericulata]
MPLPESRSRVVYKEWVRDPQGKLLEKPPPRGKRTENGIIWGHTLADFFWIPRLPGTNILTIWSRSMIQALGEHYPGNERHEDADPEPDPRRLRPWPVLTLPAHVPDPGSESASGDGSGIGYIDADCGHRHPREGAAHENGVPPTPNPSSPSSSSKQPKFSDGCGNAGTRLSSPSFRAPLTPLRAPASPRQHQPRYM